MSSSCRAAAAPPRAASRSAQDQRRHPIDYREYWGTIRVQPGDDAGELWVYNFVALEKYVRSIAEVDYDWATVGGDYYAPEAVKAQAVAARTYAMAKKGATLSDNWADQCYRGYTFEAKYPGIAKAATDTAGEILTYGGEAITAFFSGHSGGYTTIRPGRAPSRPTSWPRPTPGASRRPPPRNDPGWDWTYTISADSLSGKVNGSLKDTSGKTVNVGQIRRAGRGPRHGRRHEPRQDPPPHRQQWHGDGLGLRSAR